jgi:hypothetical protein
MRQPTGSAWLRRSSSTASVRRVAQSGHSPLSGRQPGQLATSTLSTWGSSRCHARSREAGTGRPHNGQVASVAAAASRCARAAVTAVLGSRMFRGA